MRTRHMPSKVQSNKKPSATSRHAIDEELQEYEEQKKKNSAAAPKSLSKKIDISKLPLFCDYTCEYASFPPKDAVGACRREIAVFCTLLMVFNNKNNRCLVKSSR